MGKSGPKPRPLLERFNSKFTVTANGCWDWVGKLSHGYGRLNIGKRIIPSHRAAWLLYRGEIPVGYVVCHRCNNKRCVNPDHLFVGTQADNVYDYAHKYFRGIDHPSARLTDANVLTIRQRYIAGETQPTIAADFGIHKSHVGQITRREIWTHI